MEFPPTWRVLLEEDFEVAQPQVEEALTREERRGLKWT
jgi:hypothetical protein